jgi:translation initiation factor 2 subunit 2
MHRQPEHVIAFMLAEMGTTGSVDGSGRLVIKGRFMQKQVENVLRRYIGSSISALALKSKLMMVTVVNR